MLDEIDERGADLLVVGSRDRMTTDEEVKLDLSLRLMRRAPCDTMLMRASGESGASWAYLGYRSDVPRRMP